jgi:hypothetical protein
MRRPGQYVIRTNATFQLRRKISRYATCSSCMSRRLHNYVLYASAAAAAAAMYQFLTIEMCDIES